MDTGADLPAQISALNDVSAADVRVEIDSNSTQLAAIVADTNELQMDWVDGGRLDVILDAKSTQASVDTVDGNIDSIKSKTDQLTFTQANQVDSNVQYVNDVEVTGTGADGDEWGP